MRTRSKHTAVCIATAFMAVGCTALLRNDTTASEVKPVQAVKHGGEDRSAALYAIGRFCQGQMLYDDAIAAYQQLLDQEPNHAEARNALGVIYASQGKIDKAIEALDQAISTAPQASHLRNNLGYAYILQGRYAAAEAELVRATTLDPGNDRAAENLSLARSHLTGFNNGSVELDRSSTAAYEGAGSDSPSPEFASRTEPPAELVAVGPNVYELRFPAAPGTRRKDRLAGPRAAAEKASGHLLALEVSNGNGIAGFAGRTSKYLQELGYSPARLTNQRPFNQARTEIQYRGGFQLEAQELKMALAGGPTVVESGQLRAGVEVRVVLGRDATPATLLVKSPERSVDSLKFEPYFLN